MKIKHTIGKIISCYVVCMICSFNTAFATYSWKQKADFGGTDRTAPGSFAINGKGYIGTGYDMSSNKKDFWEYDPATDVWTQKADFGGIIRQGIASFAIGGKGYMGLGSTTYPNYTFTNDWWEYDPVLNTWTQKGNFPGTSRYLPITFTIGSKGYMGTGWNQANYWKDFWEYDPAIDAWTQKADVGGSQRISAVGFSVNGKGYAGTGNYGFNMSDFWEYDPAANMWTQKANFPAPARYGATAFIINNEAYVGSGGDGFNFFNDFYKFDPVGNTWTAIAPFPGAGRRHTGAFGIGVVGYLGTGTVGASSVTNTFWEYSPDSITVAAAFTSPTTVCPGTCIDFTNQSQGATSYIWSFPGGNPALSTDANPMGVCYQSSGSYDVTLIATNSQSSDTLTMTNYITVYPSPPPQGILQNGDTLFANAGATSYQWYYNGTIIIGATDYYYIGQASGNYNVVATDTNGCEVEAVIYDVIASSQELNHSFNTETTVYPNPFHSTANFILRTKKGESKVKLEMFNAAGERIAILFDGKLHAGETRNVEFDAKELPDGIYFYRSISGSEIINGRIVFLK